MPNGKPGDNPLTDLVAHGKHPFPTDMEAMIWKIRELSGRLPQTEGQEFEWEQGAGLRQGRSLLRDQLRALGADPDNI